MNSFAHKLRGFSRNYYRSLLFTATLVPGLVGFTTLVTSTPRVSFDSVPTAADNFSVNRALPWPKSDSAAIGTWTTTGNMDQPRLSHTQTLLANGKVLVVAGQASGISRRAEVYDPSTNQWSAAMDLATNRCWHAASLLPNGKVLVTGGANSGPGYLNSAELYDPVAGTWSNAASSPSQFSSHTSTLLNSGKVLLAGGDGSASVSSSATALYDPATNTWTSGTLPSPRSHHTATLLQNGKVLLVGGVESGSNLATAALYDPTANTWTAAASMSAARREHTATLLQNGKVLVTGGMYLGEALGSAELYDPVSNTWSSAGNMNAKRMEHTATRLADGKVLVVGGRGTGGATSELYDPATNTWSFAAGLNDDRAQHSGTLLANGKVLIAGGLRQDSLLPRAELFDPAGGVGSGQQIVFGSARNGGNHDVYVMNLDGSNQVRLTTNPAYDDQPKWSPNGATIAFISNRDGNFEIYTMSADGSNQTRLTNNPAGDGFPAWSPDGTKIAFVSGDLNNQITYEIYVMNADGSNRTRLTNDALIDGVPSWSPDGTKIIFMSGVSNLFDANNFEIFTINADGSNRTRLTNNSVVDAQPSYSPNGTKILFTSGDVMDPNTGEIYLMNADGSNRIKLTNNSVTDGFPAWSPDGSKIVFANGNVLDETTVELYVMNADGTNAVRLTKNLELDWFPDWQPAPASTIQLGQSSYTVNESSAFATINVTRSGDTSTPATVKYATSDATDVNFQCNPASGSQPIGAASRKCDYHIASGRLRFGAGETSKQIILSIVNDVYVEPSESLTITLSGASGAVVGTSNTAPINITDDDNSGAANPIDGTPFYVRMLYVDLLSREPEPSGYQGWIDRIDKCGQAGQPPPPCDRVTVGGDGFLRSGEFFDREFFVLRLYRVGLGRILIYPEVGDLAYVSGFLTASDLELNKQELVTDIMSRSEFSNIYNGLSNSAFVDKLIQTAAVTIPTSVRDGWVNALNGSSKTRAQVYRELSERQEVTDKYLREAQVVSCYYGFFTRNPDGAYFTYLDRLNRGEITLGDLANAFINAAEYRQRFGP
jgi:Tol biopolymer transport system component/N-acetylneuraminic acid mutarotase